MVCIHPDFYNNKCYMVVYSLLSLLFSLNIWSYIAKKHKHILHTLSFGANCHQLLAKCFYIPIIQYRKCFIRCTCNSSKYIVSIINIFIRFWICHLVLKILYTAYNLLYRMLCFFRIFSTF